MTTQRSWCNKVGVAATVIVVILGQAGTVRAQFGRGLFGGGGGGGFGGGGGGFGGGGGRSLLDPLGVNPVLSGGFGNRGGGRGGMMQQGPMQQGPMQNGYGGYYPQQQQQPGYQQAPYQTQQQLPYQPAPYQTQPAYTAPRPTYSTQPVNTAPRVAAPASAAVITHSTATAPVRQAPKQQSTATVPPSNVIPTYKPPVAPTGPQTNVVNNRLVPASGVVRKAVDKAIERRIEELRDALDRTLEPALFQDRDLRDCLGLAEAKEANRDQLDLLSRDLRDMKLTEVLDRLQTLRVSESDYEPLISKLEVSRTYEKFKSDLDKGMPPHQIKSACRALMRGYHRVGLPESSLRTLTDELWLLSNLQETLKDAPASGPVNVGSLLSATELTIVESPTMAPGTLLALTPEVVVTGSPPGAGRHLSARLGTVAELGLPTIETSLPSAPTADGATHHGIWLRNPSANGLAVNYLLDGHAYSMAPAYDHKLDDKSSTLLEFNTGGPAGKARYTLTTGTYEFSLGKTGWNIYPKTYVITLDNTSNSSDFHYMLADGTRGTVPAGESRPISSIYPSTTVAFDRGNGQESVKKSLGEGVFSVGLDPQSRLDLFKGRRVLIPTSVAARPSDAGVVPRSSTSAGRKLLYPLEEVR